MATRFLLLFSLLLFGSQLAAQTLDNQFFGDTQGSDLLPGHLVALADGGAVIAGLSNVLDTGGYHVLLLRTDSLGEVLWQKTYHQGSGDWVAQTPDGGFVVGGASERHVFGPSKGFVLKVDAEGEPEWTQYFPMGNHSFVREVLPLSSENIAVCGVVKEQDGSNQKVFWALLTIHGSLMQYQTMDGFQFSHSPRIVEAKEGRLIMTWGNNGHESMRCFSTTGQTLWEKDLSSEFDYRLASTEFDIFVDSIGDVWLAGGYHYLLSTFDEPNEILRFSSTGDLKQRIPYQGIPAYAVGLFPRPNRRLCYRFWDPLTKHLSSMTMDSMGTIVQKDSVAIIDSLWGKFDAMVETSENRILFLQYRYQNQNALSVQPLRLSGTEHEWQPVWEFSSGLPYSHEYYEDHCSSWAGGEFVLTRGRGGAGQSGISLGQYVLKTNEDAQQTAWTFLEEGSQHFGQIVAATDGGAFVLNGEEVWKLDANAQPQWHQKAKIGQLLAGPHNDFFIVESSGQPGIYEPIRIHHFNSSGDSMSVTNVYSRSQHFYVAGVLGQVGNGPLIFANKYDEAEQAWRNWLIYLDKEGKLVREILLGSEHVFSSYTNRIISTSNGGALIASHHYLPTNGIYLMHIKEGQVLWEQTMLSSDPDSLFVQLLSIEEVPCRGFVLAISAIPRSTNTPSNKVIILQHLDENGQVKDFYSYKPLLGQLTPGGFLPGYTFHHWNHWQNGQTIDVVRQSLHFDDTAHMAARPNLLNIQPNPSDDVVCLHYESPHFGLLDIDIFNESGQRMAFFQSPKTDTHWEMTYRANFPTGLYVVRIRLGSNPPVLQRWVKAQ